MPDHLPDSLLEAAAKTQPDHRLLIRMMMWWMRSLKKSLNPNLFLKKFCVVLFVIHYYRGGGSNTTLPFFHLALTLFN
jgi:hypothetical protein